MTTGKNYTDIHIIGNGDSCENFLKWKQDNHGLPLVIGCNFSDVRFDPAFTIITDITPIKTIIGDPNMTLQIPAVISDRADNYVKTSLKGWQRVPQGKINVIDVFKRYKRDQSISKNIPPSSAHNALHYGLTKFSPCTKTVHLWGIHAFWTTDITSKTDPLVKKRGNRNKPTVTKVWNAYWKRMFSGLKNDQYEIVIHCPCLESGNKARQMLPETDFPMVKMSINTP